MSRVVKKVVVFILRPLAAMVIGLALFRCFRPAAELCAASIRKRWPVAWLSSSIVWNTEFLALTFSIVIAVVVVQHAFRRIS